MTNHTPKPWRIVRSLTCGHLRAEHNYNADPRQEFTDADIRLMQSAPDMLELLEAAYDRFTDNDMQPPNHQLKMWLKRVEAVFDSLGNSPETT